MDIQIISEYYYPDNFRINDIAAELVAKGHGVRVLTGLPDYTSSFIPKEYKKFRKRKEKIEGVDILRVPTIARRHGVFFRILSYGSFAITSSIYALFGGKPKTDVLFVYQVSPIFQGIPAIIWKKRTRKKLVLYCCDLWPESLKAWGIKESNCIFQLTKAISGWVYRSCDLVVVTSKPFMQYLTNICRVNAKKIVYLPQHAEDVYKDVAGQYVDNGICDFLFAGNIGSVQNVDCIMKAVSQISSEKPFLVHIVGDGSELENCKSLMKSLKIEDKVIFHGRYPLEEMKKFYKLADCFLLTLRGGDFIGMTLPAKSQGYLCAGKPLAAAIDGAAFEMVTESDCGLAVAAGDDSGLARIMVEVIEKQNCFKQKGINGRKFYEKHFTKKIYIETLLKLLKSED